MRVHDSSMEIGRGEVRSLKILQLFGVKLSNIGTLKILNFRQSSLNRGWIKITFCQGSSGKRTVAVEGRRTLPVVV